MIPIKRSLIYQVIDSRLRARIAWGGVYTCISLGYKIDLTDKKGKPLWNGSRCKANSFHGPTATPAFAINAALTDFEQRLNMAFLKFETVDRIPSKTQLREMLLAHERPASVWSAFDDFILEGSRQKNWAFNTVKSVKVVRDVLKMFRADLSFSDISPDLLNEFVAYLQTHRLSPNQFKSGQKGYSNATVRKYLRSLRWFLSYATKKGLIMPEDWKEFSPSVKTIAQPVVFLDWEELSLMERAEFAPGSEEERAKDFFVFCCFTGLRYSDAAALKRSAVYDTYFEIVTQKTSTPLRIEFNDHSRAIILKYAEMPGEYALPRITNNRLNHLLKDIGEVLGIDSPVSSTQYYGGRKIERTVPKYEKLSSHCGRRTFICNALSLGIAPQIVMKWTGHSEYSAMKPYIDITSKTKEASMTLFNRPTPQPTPQPNPQPNPPKPNP